MPVSDGKARSAAPERGVFVSLWVANPLKGRLAYMRLSVRLGRISAALPQRYDLMLAMPAAGMPAVVVMVSAGVAVLVVMVVALEVGAGRESSGEIGLDRRFRVA